MAESAIQRRLREMGLSSGPAPGEDSVDVAARLAQLDEANAAATAADADLGSDPTKSASAPTTTQSGVPTTNETTTVPNSVAASDAPTRYIDRRARLRPKPGAENYIYGDSSGTGLLTVLRETGGMLFPSTPTINETHSVQYSSYSPSHAMTRFNSFERTDNVKLNVSGEFFVTNESEARYVLACIHFLRSITKMDFGMRSETRGTPPPVLIFSAYGNFMYNDIPVVVKAVSFTLDPDIDYIQVPLLGSNTDFSTVNDFFEVDSSKADRVWVPSKLNIAFSLEQQGTPSWLSNEFNLNEFKRGDLLTKGGII